VRARLGQVACRRWRAHRAREIDRIEALLPRRPQHRAARARPARAADPGSAGEIGWARLERREQQRASLRPRAGDRTDHRAARSTRRRANNVSPDNRAARRGSLPARSSAACPKDHAAVERATHRSAEGRCRRERSRRPPRSGSIPYGAHRVCAGARRDRASSRASWRSTPRARRRSERPLRRGVSREGLSARHSASRRTTSFGSRGTMRRNRLRRYLDASTASVPGTGSTAFWWASRRRCSRSGGESGPSNSSSSTRAVRSASPKLIVLRLFLATRSKKYATIGVEGSRATGGITAGRKCKD